MVANETQMEARVLLSGCSGAAMVVRKGFYRGKQGDVNFWVDLLKYVIFAALYMISVVCKVVASQLLRKLSFCCGSYGVPAGC